MNIICSKIEWGPLPTVYGWNGTLYLDPCGFELVDMTVKSL